MPTHPLQSILDRDLSKAAARDLIAQYTCVIDDLVNEGTNVFARCKPATPTVGSDEDSVPLLLYLHIIEMADAVSALLKEVCATPALPLARTIFEGTLSLEYMLAEDSSRRARSWLAWFTHERKNACDDLLKKSSAGHKTVAPEPSFDFSKLAAGLEADKKRYEAYLAKPEVIRIGAEIGRRKHWYSLSSGPTNLWMLAKELHRENEYVTFYKSWSEITHVVDLGRFMARNNSPDQTTRLLRDANDLMFKVAGMAAIIFTLRATRLVLNKFRPGENWHAWYVREIKPRVDQLRPL